MLKLSILFSIFVASISVHAQRCNSDVKLNLTDKRGKAIPSEQLSIKDPRRGQIKNFGTVNSPDFRWHVGCAAPHELLLIIYKSEEMRLHFNLPIEFNDPIGSFTFRKGDFVVELVQNGPYTPGLSIRKAKKEDLKP